MLYMPRASLSSRDPWSSEKAEKYESPFNALNRRTLTMALGFALGLPTLPFSFTLYGEGRAYF